MKSVRYILLTVALGMLASSGYAAQHGSTTVPRHVVMKRGPSHAMAGAKRSNTAISGAGFRRKR